MILVHASLQMGTSPDKESRAPASSGGHHLQWTAMARRIPEVVPNVAEDGHPILPFASEDLWREWLVKHHELSQGVWLKIAKKESGIPSVSYSQALDVALCFGWIDGQKNKLDETSWLQRFTPRRARSVWSSINRERVAVLLEKELMVAAGLREVERAKADGRWDSAYQGQRTAEIPEDLAEELATNQKAADFFSALDRANRYAILYRLGQAKRPETRARKLQQFLEMLKKGDKLHP
jgi:uncharacterized protein YdeI (YjbR/CyaY-like superfamily)